MTSPGWDRLLLNDAWGDNAEKYLSLRDRLETNPPAEIKFRIKSRMMFLYLDSLRIERTIFDGMTFDEWRISGRIT